MITERIFIRRADLIAMHAQMLLSAGCKEILGFPGYFVSRFGDVFSVKGQGFPTRKLSPGVKPGGYEFVGLRDGIGACKYRMVHRLVAEAFIPNPERLQEVNHKDGNKRHNHANNLEWMTRQQNAQHAFDIGLQKRGSESPFSKLTPEQILEVRMADGPYRDIGERYGICAETVQRIKNSKKPYTYLTGPALVRRKWHPRGEPSEFVP